MDRVIHVSTFVFGFTNFQRILSASPSFPAVCSSPFAGALVLEGSHDWTSTAAGSCRMRLGNLAASRDLCHSRLSLIAEEKHGCILISS